MIRVVVVDDHSLFRAGVTHTLNSDTDIQIVGEGANRDDAIRLARDLLPDILLLDIRMPGGGVEAARSIAVTCPVIKIAMLTISEREDDVIGSLQAGARGYILKGIAGPALIEILKDLYNGSSYVSPGLAARLLSELSRQSLQPDLPKVPFPALTTREEQILEGVAKGLSNKEISLDLGISGKTVKNYISNVLQKLHVRNRVEAALLAKERSKSGDV